jgi:hypothetical protein
MRRLADASIGLRLVMVMFAAWVSAVMRGNRSESGKRPWQARLVYGHSR